MANVLTRQIKKSHATAVTDEILSLLDTISENARLAQENDKELKRLRKLNDKTFAQMKRTVDRVIAG